MSLHPDKTRLMEFGRYAAVRPQESRSWQTGDLHLPGLHLHLRQIASRGISSLQRKTRRDRMRAKLRQIKEELRRACIEPIPAQGEWLGQVVSGHFAYHAVPTNSRALVAFRHHVTDLWRRTLRRRSQKDGITWERMTKMANAWLPPTAHPSSVAKHALRRQTPEVGAGCPNWARPDLCGGRSVMGVPTAILVRCWLAAQIDPNEATHRGAVIQRIFHRRVRQVEPDLQKINPQHPVNANRRAAAIPLGIMRFDQSAQLAPRHNRVHLSQKPLPARLFAVEVKANT